MASAARPLKRFLGLLPELKIPAAILGFMALCWYALCAASGAADRWARDAEVAREAEIEQSDLQIRLAWEPWFQPIMGHTYPVPAERASTFQAWSLPLELTFRGWVDSAEQMRFLPPGKPGDFYRLKGNDHVWVWPLPPLTGWIDP
jgi:hypothetical protein